MLDGSLRTIRGVISLDLSGRESSVMLRMKIRTYICINGIST